MCMDGAREEGKRRAGAEGPLEGRRNGAVRDEGESLCELEGNMKRNGDKRDKERDVMGRKRREERDVKRKLQEKNGKRDEKDWVKTNRNMNKKN